MGKEKKARRGLGKLGTSKATRAGLRVGKLQYLPAGMYMYVGSRNVPDYLPAYHERGIFWLQLHVHQPYWDLRSFDKSTIASTPLSLLLLEKSPLLLETSRLRTAQRADLVPTMTTLNTMGIRA
jgi:hypothetical protein